MTAPRLTARVENVEKPERGFVVRSPSVGWIEGIPAQGDHLGASASLLLHLHGRKVQIQLPHGVSGWVTERLAANWAPVEFNQPLLRLSLASAPGAKATETAERGVEGFEQGLVPVPAPSEGVFYRRPKPDAAPYVDVGTAVGPGTVLGLVEIMKSFNQVVYGDAGLPERGTIVKALVAESAEVRFGQPLFLVRPD